MASALPTPPSFSSKSDNTPTRRRQAEPSNHDLLASFATDDSNENDDSKKRRNMHIQVGPMVISGAALDRVQARFFSL